MSWSIGFDSNWNRDIGYGVPCECDSPKCKKQIHRGLAHVCGGEPYGGDVGCGLYFCGSHLWMARGTQLCARCKASKPHYRHPKPDLEQWVKWKLTDASWKQWRDENKDEVLAMSTRVTGVKVKDGKVVRVHKMSVSKKIGAKAKADRRERAWRKASTKG